MIKKESLPNLAGPTQILPVNVRGPALILKTETVAVPWPDPYTCIWNMFLKFRSYYSNEYGWMDGWLQGLTSTHSHTCITTKSISHDYDFHNLFAWQNYHKAQYMELKISIVYVTDGNSTIHVYAEHNIKPGTYFNKEFHSQYKCQIQFSSQDHPKCNKMIDPKFCICHNICAVVVCAKFLKQSHH